MKMERADFIALMKEHGIDISERTQMPPTHYPLTAAIQALYEAIRAIPTEESASWKTVLLLHLNEVRFQLTAEVAQHEPRGLESDSAFDHLTLSPTLETLELAAWARKFQAALTRVLDSSVVQDAPYAGYSEAIAQGRELLEEFRRTHGSNGNGNVQASLPSPPSAPTLRMQQGTAASALNLYQVYLDAYQTIVAGTEFQPSLLEAFSAAELRACRLGIVDATPKPMGLEANFQVRPPRTREAFERAYAAIEREEE